MPDQRVLRPHVLLITRNLPPLQGGMERLVGRMAEFLDQRCTLSVIGPKGCSAFLPADIEVQEVAFQSLWRFFLEASRATWRAVRRNGFSVVIAGSGLTAPLAWWAARRSSATFAVYLHGLDIVAPSVVYQRGWVPFFRRADVVLVNSRNTRKLALQCGVSEDLIRVLHPGTEIPGFDATMRQRFRAELGLDERPVLLSVGRLTARKGLAEFIIHCMPRILQREPDAVLLIIGADAKNAANTPAASEGDRIRRAARKAGIAPAVRFLPPCDDQALTAAYRAADVYVFPVLDLPGDVEGFGMVAIEAAAHGLPTVGFSVGGVPDAVIDGKTGSLVDSGDYTGFVDRVLDWLATGGDSRNRCVAEATAFGWGRFAEQLHQHLLDRGGPET